MKKGWTYKKLGEICRIGIGRTPSRSDMSLWDKNKETHNYWVSIADMGATENGYIADTKEYISDKAAENIQIIPKGTLLLSFKLTLGKTAIAGTDLYTNEAIANLPFIGNEVNREFLSYYFQFFNWEKFSAGDEKVLGKTLNKKKLDVLPVYYPSIKEQKRIVERLDAAFAQIDDLKAYAEKQLAEARALFQKALAKAMEPKEGWEEKKLKDIVLTITDGDHQPPPKSSDGIPFITISNIDKESNKIDFEDTFHVPQTYFNGLKSDRIPQQGDVLYTVTGSFGIPVLIDYKKDFCFQRHIALIRPNQKLLLPEFLYYWILSDYAKAQAEDTATGAAQRTVSLNSLRKFNISIPPLSEQQRIVERLDSISENVRKYEEIKQKIIAECDALKQALLRQVFE